MKLLSQRGQSTGEYAILVTIVLGAVIAIQSAVRNRVAQRILDQATAYNATAANLQTSSDQTSFTQATMTNANQGTAGTSSAGTSASQSP